MGWDFCPAFIQDHMQYFIPGMEHSKLKFNWKTKKKPFVFNHVTSKTWGFDLNWRLSESEPHRLTQRTMVAANRVFPVALHNKQTKKWDISVWSADVQYEGI